MVAGAKKTKKIGLSELTIGPYLRQKKTHMLKTYKLLLAAIMNDTESYEEIADPDNIIFGIKFGKIFTDRGGRSLYLEGVDWNGVKYSNAYIDLLSQKVAFGKDQFGPANLIKAIHKWNTGDSKWNKHGIVIATFIAPLTNIIS